jgi:hypothetical protein
MSAGAFSATTAFPLGAIPFAISILTEDRAGRARAPARFAIAPPVAPTTMAKIDPDPNMQLSAKRREPCGRKGGHGK